MPLVARHAGVALEPDALLDNRWWKVEDEVLVTCEAALRAQVEVVPPSRQELVSYGLDAAAQLAQQFNSLRKEMEAKKGVLTNDELDGLLGTNQLGVDSKTMIRSDKVIEATKSLTTPQKHTHVQAYAL